VKSPAPAPIHITAHPRLTLTRAEGIHVWDTDGRRYLDATSGAFCVQLGYSRPDLVRAMSEAAVRLPHARPSLATSEVGSAYQDELLAAAGEPYTRVVLTNSGSEAVDVAIKIAHRYHAAIGHPERTSVRHLSGHFHGATLGALGVTGHRPRRAPYEAMLRGAPGGTSAMILETIPAIGLGAPVPPPGYLAGIRARCDAESALWIADEVLTGFGRVGALFAWQRLAERRAADGAMPDSEAVPDMMVFGKGAGAGFAPVAGVLIADRVTMALGESGFSHFQTYGGNPISCSVGRAVLHAMAEEEIAARVRDSESSLERTLRSLLELPYVQEIRGLGFLWAIVLAEDRAAGRPFARERRAAELVAIACRERGVLVHGGAGCYDGEQGDFILIAPPLIAGMGSFRTIVDAIAEAIPVAIE